MPDTIEFQAFDWQYEDVDDVLVINIFGRTADGKTILCKVRNFTPYVYLQLPDYIKWTSVRATSLCEVLSSHLYRNPPQKKLLCRKKRLYFANMEMKDDQLSTKEYPYLFLSFKNQVAVNTIRYNLRQKITIPGIGSVLLKAHEDNADPIIKFTAQQNLKLAGWMKVQGELLSNDSDDKISKCQLEIDVDWRKVEPIERDTIAPFRFMHFDLEVMSTRAMQFENTFPDATLPGDVVYQVGVVIDDFGAPESARRKFLLCYHPRNDCAPIEGVEIRNYRKEMDLIIGFGNLISEEDPDALWGYNILNFDWRYWIKRAEKTGAWPRFAAAVSRIITQKAKVKDISWSSSAFKNNEYKMVDIPGRISVDLMPVIVMLGYKFSDYRLNTISQKILKDKKDDLPPQKMFEKYHRGSSEDLRVIGKYCIQDTDLCVRLDRKMSIWIGLVENTNVVHVPIMYIFTRGQGVKVFSQLYRECMENNYVCERDVFDAATVGKYSGATVIEPTPGYYKWVICLDFRSLYPSIMMAYNISHNTLVKETREEPDIKIPDELCHVIEWTDTVPHPDAKTPKEKKTKTIQVSHRYRFLKEPEGMLPIMLQRLLDARNNAKAEGKKVFKRLQSGDYQTEEEKSQLDVMAAVYDKRQLNYKISMNSQYGVLGAKTGYCPLLPCAMSVTARGRELLMLAKAELENKYHATIIYGDTDSIMFVLPNIDNATDCWTEARKIEKEINKIFPPKVYFELEKVMSKMISFKKKMYYAELCDDTGKIVDILTKGIALVRRDRVGILKSIYNKMMRLSVTEAPIEDFFEALTFELHRLFTNQVDIEDLIMTCELGKEYKNENVVQVIFSKKMQERGQPITPGTRMRFLFIKVDDPDANQGPRAEDPDYYLNNRKTCHIDPIYYLESKICNSIDQIFSVVWNRPKTMKQILRSYKAKDACNNKIREIFSPIKFV